MFGERYENQSIPRVDPENKLFYLRFYGTTIRYGNSWPMGQLESAAANCSPGMAMLSFASSYCLADVPSPSAAIDADADGEVLPETSRSECAGLESESVDFSCGSGGSSWQEAFALLEDSLLSTCASANGENALLSIASGAANRREYQPRPRPQRDRCVGAEQGSGSSAPRAVAARISRTASAQPAERPLGGQTTADMGNGMNMDKRQCRRLHREDFKAGIDMYRAQAQPLPAMVAQAHPSAPHCSDVTGWVRKRPLLPHEEADGEYDVITVGPGTLTTHTALMKPDLRRMFLRNATFTPSGGTFGEVASSEEVYESVGRPLVELALSGGRGAHAHAHALSGCTCTCPPWLPRLRGALLARPDDNLSRDDDLSCLGTAQGPSSCTGRRVRARR